jgi:hypothetical protein
MLAGFRRPPHDNAFPTIRTEVSGRLQCKPTDFVSLDPSRTKCLGRDEPSAIEFLDKDGFEKVLEL